MIYALTFWTGPIFASCINHLAGHRIYSPPDNSENWKWSCRVVHVQSPNHQQPISVFYPLTVIIGKAIIHLHPLSLMWTLASTTTTDIVLNKQPTTSINEEAINIWRDVATQRSTCVISPVAARTIVTIIVFDPNETYIDEAKRTLTSKNRNAFNDFPSSGQ